MDDNPYLEFLTDGGYMVETMAKLLYPEGREIGGWDKPEQGFAETQKVIAAGNCTLFESTIIHGKLLARVDILQRFGKVLRLIEVKSSSVNLAEDGENPFRGKRGGIDAEWRPYLEDVAFQAVVLRRAFPEFEVIPYLCVVDKARTATANSTFDKFHLHRTDKWRPEVAYLGKAARLAKEHVLAILDAADVVAEISAEVATAADELATSLSDDAVDRIAPQLGLKCKKCEYRLAADEKRNGFRECWGKLAKPDPHLLDLYRVDLAGGKNGDLVAHLIALGKAALGDVPEEILNGATAARQRVQLEYSAKNREWIDPDLPVILRRHVYPLHFIDFEASRLAIPYHVGMRPYEIAAFQWSWHSLHTGGAPLEHNEWLNAQDAFPNFEFARSLRKQIGDKGTIYIWSPYEKSVLREIRRQMDDYGEHDADLATWLERITRDKNPRVVDLCELAKLYYFHPAMRGSLSIKHVLPAVWEADAVLRADPDFAKYVRRDAVGRLLNPYATLPPLPIGEQEEIVNEGTGAMRVYQEMMFGVKATDPTARETYRRLLLQYCGLDTAAMVMVWKHWTR